jgi:hypothetical protein
MDGKHAEQEAVGETRQARDEAEEVRVRDADGAELGDAEDDAGEDEAPGAVGVQDLDEEVGADAWGLLVMKLGGLVVGGLTTQQPAAEAGNRQDRDVHLLAIDEVGLIYRIIVELPDRLDVLANVAVSRSAESFFQQTRKLT